MHLRVAHVLRFYAWHERRVPQQSVMPRRDGRGGGVHEVAVISDLLTGGSLLQRACARPYTEQHVRLLGVALGTALKQLAAKSVEAVNLSPWSLLYASEDDAASATGALHEGVMITNVGLGCHCRRNCAQAAPHLALFEAPELRDGSRRGHAGSRLLPLAASA